MEPCLIVISARQYDAVIMYVQGHDEMTINALVRNYNNCIEYFKDVKHDGRRMCVCEVMTRAIIKYLHVIWLTRYKQR